MDISLNVKKAMDFLKEHRQKHVDEYAAQIQGWKKSMEDYAKELAVWRDDTPEDIFEAKKYEAKKPMEPQKPRSFVETYDELILMLEYHSEKTILVSEHEFDQIVKDEFGWKGEFLANSARYL